MEVGSTLEDPQELLEYSPRTRYDYFEKRSNKVL